MGAGTGGGCSCGNEGGDSGRAVLMRTRVVTRGACSCDNEGGGTEGAALVRTMVVAREGLLLWERGLWHGGACSCDNEAGGTGAGLFL